MQVILRISDSVFYLQFLWAWAFAKLYKFNENQVGCEVSVSVVIAYKPEEYGSPYYYCLAQID